MFVGVGCLLLFFFVWQAGENLYVIATYERARAEVTRCDRIGPVSSKGLNSYGVTVRFDGRTASMKDAITRYEVGEVTTVYYRPETAYTVIGGSFMQMWFIVSCIGAVAGMFLFFGLKPDRDDR